MLRRRHTFTFGLGALAVALLCGSVLLARPGVVTHSDGTKYVGDVQQQDDTITVTRTDGQELALNQGQVTDIRYFKNFREEFDARLASIEPKDAKTHVALARMAAENDEPELAERAAAAALKIEPRNADAQKVLDTLRKDQPRDPAATDPADPGAGGGNDPAPAGGGGGAGGISGRTRLVTPDEINRIRQVEWMSRKATNPKQAPREAEVRVRVEPEARSGFVARIGMRPGDFNRLDPAQQARMILEKGTKKQRAGVHILTDPPTMLEFRRGVHKTVLSGCATTGCHGGQDVESSFVLHTVPERAERGREDAVVYTNYLILNDYITTIEEGEDRKTKVQRQMVDRTQPDQSLLAHYVLLPAVTDMPHPDVQGFKAPFRATNAPGYQAIMTWLNGLPTLMPDYGVDLSREPAEEEEPEAGGDAPPRRTGRGANNGGGGRGTDDGGGADGARAAPGADDDRGGREPAAGRPGARRPAPAADR